MTTLPSRTFSIAIEAPYEAAYDFAHRPENFPLWAAGMSSDVRVDFSPHNAFGVMDHTVHLPDGAEVYVPLRMVRNDDGVEVSFLLLRQPGMDDEMFERDASAVEADLRALKHLLEDRHQNRSRATSTT